MAPLPWVRGQTEFVEKECNERGGTGEGQFRQRSTHMATRMRWLGHSCLWFESDVQKVLIDPFLTGNPVAPVKADDLRPDFILVSHGHGDHLGDAVAIAKRTGATVV